MEHLDRCSVLRLSPACRLQWEATRHYYLLLYPAGAVPLSHRAGAVLSRCDGVRPVQQIVQDLCGQREAPEIEADVVSLLRSALSQGWLCAAEPAQAGKQGIQPQMNTDQRR